MRRSNSAFIVSAFSFLVVFVNNNVYLKALEKRERQNAALLLQNTSKQEELLKVETELKKREAQLSINEEKWRSVWEKRMLK